MAGKGWIREGPRENRWWLHRGHDPSVCHPSEKCFQGGEGYLDGEGGESLFAS